MPSIPDGGADEYVGVYAAVVSAMAASSEGS